jgi:hypothetical protein
MLSLARLSQACGERIQKEEMTQFQIEELISVAAENSPVNNQVCEAFISPLWLVGI